MKKILSNPRFHDGLHISVIILGFVVIISFPFWVGLLAIAIHTIHQKIIDGCILTKIAKKCGAMKEGKTFFVQLMENLKVPNPKKSAKIVDTCIKLALVGIVLWKMIWALVK